MEKLIKTVLDAKKILKSHGFDLDLFYLYHKIRANGQKNPNRKNVSQYVLDLGI
jgi:hypothetical protein